MIYENHEQFDKKVLDASLGSYINKLVSVLAFCTIVGSVFKLEKVNTIFKVERFLRRLANTKKDVSKNLRNALTLDR